MARRRRNLQEKAVVNAFTGKTLDLFTRLDFDNCEIQIEENWHDC